MNIKIFILPIFIFLFSFSNAEIPPAFVEGTKYGITSIKNSCVMVVEIGKNEMSAKSKVDLKNESCKQIRAACDFLENIIKIQFQNDELNKGRFKSAMSQISKIRKYTEYLPYEYDSNLPDDIKFMSTEGKVKMLELCVGVMTNDVNALINGEPKDSVNPFDEATK